MSVKAIYLRSLFKSYIRETKAGMRIVIDDKIPYIKNVFEQVADVVYCNGADINNELVKDADALIIRTRTICNKELLKGSKLKFIATATIGYDHIDRNYCEQNNISWTNAPGCNSKSVVQYMAVALLHLAEEKKKNLQDLCIGIIGVGSVGSKLANFCQKIGMRVLLNDPPREEKEPENNSFSSIESIQNEADIISLHVPLVTDGKHSTLHLINEAFLRACKKSIWLFNTCRGEVTNTDDIIAAYEQGKITGLVIDCWENEPNISLKLLTHCDIATPHIAGYSKDGKANGTKMAVQATSRFFNLGIDDWECKEVEEAPNRKLCLDEKGSEQAKLYKLIKQTYNILDDDFKLRQDINKFEHYRANYAVRREFEHFTVTASNINNRKAELLTDIGFKLEIK